MPEMIPVDFDAVDYVLGDEQPEIEWVQVALFEAGRMRLMQDHNGNVELTIRIPPDHRKAAYGVTDFAGIRLLVAISVPSEAT